MARTSKIALAVASGLAALAVLAGTAVAVVPTSAAGNEAIVAVAETPGADSQLGGSRVADGGWNSRGDGRGAHGSLSGMGPMTRGDGWGYWNAGEILQWIMLGLLGGAVVAAAIWRPWRRDRTSVPAPVTTEAQPQVTPVTPEAPRQTSTLDVTSEPGSATAVTQAPTSPPRRRFGRG